MNNNHLQIGKKTSTTIKKTNYNFYTRNSTLSIVSNCLCTVHLKLQLFGVTNSMLTYRKKEKTNKNMVTVQKVSRIKLQFTLAAARVQTKNILSSA